MSDFDIEAIQAEVRAMDFVRGSPAEVAMWREDMAESRHNLVIEDMIPTSNEDAFFELMLDEAVPPPLVSQILLRLVDHPNADRSLPITPMTVAGRPPWPVLFLLDEFAALGRLEPVERAMGLMAGYGVQIWPILQDVHQLRALYGQRAGTFLSNAGVLQVFGVNDTDSAKLVSDEVRTLRPDRQLLFLAGQRPIVAAKLRYYADREFAGRFDPA